jgi:energy-coupling factor transporter transmembrane protein EcfT
MLSALNEEKIITGDAFKSYIRSSRFLGTPVIIGFVAVLGIMITVLLIKTLKDNLIILALVGIFFIIYILLFWVTYNHIRDAVSLKVRVRRIKAEKIDIWRHKVTTYRIVYSYQGKTYHSEIPHTWFQKLSQSLPSEAVLYTAYYSNKAMKIELVQTGEVFSVV